MTETPKPEGAAWQRLLDQLGWYERKSAHAKRWFHRLKVVQIVIVVLEGLQSLFQFQQNWMTYRATAEALKHEQFLYLAGAGPYTGAGQPGALLAERVEGLVSQEHATWTQAQSHGGEPGRVAAA
ncbi:MAG: DUF4231 domain-containing protein [Solirubrobacteraceae bacterium]